MGNRHTCANKIAKFHERNPYVIHRELLIVFIIYISKERLRVSFVLIVFTTWGRNNVEAVKAAIVPTTCVKFIIPFPFPVWACTR